MFSRSIVNRRAYGLALLVILASASEALAGGFYLSVEMPSANNPQHKDAVLLVRPYGCHQPSDAVMTATAEGVVNGERRSVPLQMTRVSEGIYAIRQEWPAGGAWVLAINGAYNGHDSGVLVRLGADGKATAKQHSSKNDVNAKTFTHKLTREEIESALAGAKTTNTARAAASPVGVTKMGIGLGSGLGLAALSLAFWQIRRHKAE